MQSNGSEISSITDYGTMKAKLRNMNTFSKIRFVPE
jgi:hypothetical protein